MMLSDDRLINFNCSCVPSLLGTLGSVYYRATTEETTVPTSPSPYTTLTEKTCLKNTIA